MKKRQRLITTLGVATILFGLSSVCFADSFSVTFKENTGLKGGESVFLNGEKIGQATLQNTDQSKRLTVEITADTLKTIPVHSYGKIETKDGKQVLVIRTVQHSEQTLANGGSLEGVKGELEEASLKASLSLSAGTKNISKSLDETSEDSKTLGDKLQKEGNKVGKSIDGGVNDAASTIKGWFSSDDESSEE